MFTICNVKSKIPSNVEKKVTHNQTSQSVETDLDMTKICKISTFKELPNVRSRTKNEKRNGS